MSGVRTLYVASAHEGLTLRPDNTCWHLYTLLAEVLPMRGLWLVEAVLGGWEVEMSL